MNHISQTIEDIQRRAFRYFSTYADPENGLIPDSTQHYGISSIAAVGFALSCYPVAVRRGWVTREDARAYCLAALRFLDGADMSGSADASGFRGFFYHFLDMKTGRRAWKSELSTIDTALLLAGVLTAAAFFDGRHAGEAELRRLADAVYARTDWAWAQNGGAAISLGWKPESGFLRWRWIGYSEALILYALALGSPTHAVGADAYEAWLGGYRWKRIYGLEHLYAGPLFIHQFSHLWIDFRGIADRYMAARGIDYFENSRRATQLHREYAIRNPRRWNAYSGTCWGLTASNGPGPARRITVNGRRRAFHGYCARGAPWGTDDGTVSPWAVVASLPFAPDIVAETITHLASKSRCQHEGFGFYSSFNPSWGTPGDDIGWVFRWHVALNQGPMVLMIENHRDGFLWDLMRDCAPLVQGLRRAGFRGGWMDQHQVPAVC